MGSPWRARAQLARGHSMKKILALLARAPVGFALLAAPELRAKAIEKMKTDGYMTDGL